MSQALFERVCIVTGAGQGIGAATARAMFEEGAFVCLSDVDGSAASAQAAVIDPDSVRTLALAHDVTSEASWQQVVERCRARFGVVDVLVNNAGIYFNKPLLEMTLDDLRRLMAVNLEGVFLGTQSVIRAMADRPSGAATASIINMSSVAGLVGASGSTAYSLTKGGVRLFTKAAAIELAPKGIRVNSVHPGLIETAMGAGIVRHRAALADRSEDEQRHEISADVPLRRMGQPLDVASAIVFLASDASSFVTGTELVVDGGHTAR
ncbi:glucose 1-dehydrogenase [soil metagenome]